MSGTTDEAAGPPPDRRATAPPEPDSGLLERVGERRPGRWDVLDWLLTGRREEPRPSSLGLVERPDPEGIGICCSGGGIRSAAFNLGALQALSEKGVLKKAKYLAAVSGGSYIAASLCMVAKTPPPRRSRSDEQFDDSDPSLLAAQPPFDRGSPEEQYLRNRSSYLAPTGLAKLFLVYRVLLGLLFNLFFLGLLMFAVGVALATWLYRPEFGDLAGARRCGQRSECFDAQLPLGAEVALAAVAVAIVALGIGVLLLRVRNDALRMALETWAVRALLLGAALVVVLVAIPVLTEAVRDATAREGTATASETAGASALPAIGAGSVASLLAAVLLQLRARAAEPATVLKGAKGAAAFWRKLAPRLRTAFAYLAGAIAGPLALLAILMLGVLLTLAHSDTDGTSAGMYMALLCALCAFVLIYAFADLNAWSLHPFYRRRLCSAFALRRVDDGAGPEARERDYGRLVPLSQSRVERGPGDSSWPALIVCAAANVSDPGATPPGRGVTSFTFTPTAIGGPLVGATSTATYEWALGRNRQRDITLPAAVAMSGAALSPSMGKLTRRPLTFLMALANVRLGVWVPNPRHLHDWRQRRVLGGEHPLEPIGADGKPAGARDVLKRPRPSYLFRELIGRNRLDARFLYVSDGGHYENLGLVELLRRGCTAIYCFDASGGASFEALGDAIALARSELNVEIDLDPRPLVEKGPRMLAERGCVVGDITYPDAAKTTGRLVFARTVMTEDLPWDVHAYHEADRTFPHHSTADQLYTDQKFEAYRALGECAGRHAVDALAPAADAPGSEPAGQTSAQLDLGRWSVRVEERSSEPQPPASEA